MLAKVVFMAVVFLSSQVVGQQNLKEAMHYVRLPDGKVNCRLCPRKCVIKNNDTGYCEVRKNIDGTLYSLVYGKPVSIAIDPIEKKPVFHVLPGSESFSFATVGCNLRCIHCQNWQISQIKPSEAKTYDFTAEEMVELAIKNRCKSISYTYTEPTVYYEYMLDICKVARKKGLKNIWVTSGYINPGPLKELCKYLDVGRVDLKGFTEEFYAELAAASLEPVLNTLLLLKKEKVWIEVINLIIPGYNDNPNDIKRMCQWIKENLGADTPLYFSRFFPHYKLTSVPPTPVATLENARKIARSVGLRFVYIGNVSGHEGESTYCPKCKKFLIKRLGYSIIENNIVGGKCKFCGEKIPGIWQ